MCRVRDRQEAGRGGCPSGVENGGNNRHGMRERMISMIGQKRTIKARANVSGTVHRMNHHKDRSKVGFLAYRTGLLLDSFSMGQSRTLHGTHRWRLKSSRPVERVSSSQHGHEARLWGHIGTTGFKDPRRASSTLPQPPTNPSTIQVVTSLTLCLAEALCASGPAWHCPFQRQRMPSGTLRTLLS